MIGDGNNNNNNERFLRTVNAEIVPGKTSNYCVLCVLELGNQAEEKREKKTCIKLRKIAFDPSTTIIIWYYGERRVINTIVIGPFSTVTTTVPSSARRSGGIFPHRKIILTPVVRNTVQIGFVFYGPGKVRRMGLFFIFLFLSRVTSILLIRQLILVTSLRKPKI